MKSKIGQYDNDTFKELVALSTSMRELSRKLGYTGGGYNGEAILKRCEKLGITKQYVSKCLKDERPWNGYYFTYLYPTYWDKYQIISD